MNEYGTVYEWVDLKKYNTYHIGGKAHYLVVPFKDKLISFINYLDNNHIKWYILGNGSNIIIPDEDFDGVIIKLDNFNDITFKDNECIVGAGLLINTLVGETLKNGYTNLAFLSHLPGTIGGVINSNAGCFGHETFDYLKDVTFLDENKNLITLPKEDIEHGYRYSEFKNRNCIILQATFNLERGNVEETLELVKNNLAKRRDTQPIDEYTAGSVFRNPDIMSAGKLIDDAGLKGTTYGGAKVSNKHANFIVNYNNATSKDILNLIRIVQKEIKKVYNIELELEQIVLKW